jgi:hypothetical protein
LRRTGGFAARNPRRLQRRERRATVFRDKTMPRGPAGREIWPWRRMKSPDCSVRPACCAAACCEPMALVRGIRGDMNASWVPGLILLLATPAQATQVFSHETGPVRWEAEVGDGTFVLREKRGGAIAGGAFVCPLGSGVRASVTRTGADNGRVCLVFSKNKCAYTGAEGAPVDTPAPQSGTTTFKCVDFATVEQASRLAALINAGAPTRRQAGSVRSVAGAKGPAEAARPSRAPLPPSAPQKSPFAPGHSASGLPAFASGEADPAVAKMLARAQERAAVSSSSRADAAAESRTSAFSIPTPQAKPSPQEGKPEASTVSRLEGGRGP